MTTAQTLHDLLPLLIDIKQTDINEQIYQYLETIDRKRLKQLRTRLDRVIEIKKPAKLPMDVFKGKKSHAVGRVFEAMLKCLFAKGQALSAMTNVRSTTSEIDILLEVKPLGNVVPLLKVAGTHILAEAKCYSKALKSEWINELKGVLDSHAAKVGILFIGGRPKQIAIQARTLIAIFSGQGYRLIPIGRTQITAVESGQSFLGVLSTQGVAASVHTTKLHI